MRVRTARISPNEHPARLLDFVEAYIGTGAAHTHTRINYICDLQALERQNSKFDGCAALAITDWLDTSS